jgi:serine/threonine protein kinase
MATMFGRFEIQSELSKSETAFIYKALDTTTNQVVALKTQSLEPLAEHRDAFLDTLMAEGETTRDLAGQNIVVLYGAGEIEGQFCAAMEYIQGNSIATMLARQEGFSIWDLLDISRQVCAGLELAAAKGVIHCSLEPAKIMVQWDGMVKILGYGISNMSLIEAESGKGLGRLMPYCSPEQIRGEAIDLRSNLFTLGAILYEMVVGRPAFAAADPVALVQQIENEMPANPSTVNAKIQPAVSAVIMKALAKDPAERYQTARELLDDLEQCKENSKKAGDGKKPAAAAPKVAVSSADRAAASSKFVSPSTSPAKFAVPSAAAASLAPSGSVSPRIEAPAQSRAAAAAAAGSGAGTTPDRNVTAGMRPAAAESNPSSNSGSRFISDFEVSVPEAQAAGSPFMSAAVVEPEPASASYTPGAAVDPLMAAPQANSASRSFSDLAEMPPLKEPVFVPSIPAISEPEQVMRPALRDSLHEHEEEKPRIQPREIAEKAFRQIATIPPRLMMFSILGAVGLILVVSLAVYLHVRTEDDGSTAAPRPTKSAKSISTQPGGQTSPALAKAAPLAPPMEPQPTLKVRPVERHSNSARRAPAPAPAPAPVVLPGQALIDSSPQGAQFQVDGKSDPSWITPFNLADLSPGKHIVSVSKAGYSSDIRAVEVASGSKSSLVVHLAPVNALMVLNSTPPGATIAIDGKPTGRVTPAQFAIEKGSHTIQLHKQGYLDETVTTELAPAQNFPYAPVLRALGNTEDMRTVGKLNRLFGRGGESAAGMGSITIHTQPKGAQVAINQQVLDKTSPVGVMVAPGNYVVEITLTGFKPIRKIVGIDKGGKAAVDEILERQ